VNHPEYLYLVARAHAVRDEEDKAAAEGDDFLAANHFVPLAAGGAAQARIDRIGEAGTPAFVLTLRGCEDPDRVAAGFFTTADFERLGPNSRGDHVYRTTVVPAPLRPPEDRDAPVRHGPDAAAQPATPRGRHPGGR